MNTTANTTINDNRREFIKSVVICPNISITTNKKIYTTPNYPDYIEQTITLNGVQLDDGVQLLFRVILDSVFVCYTEYSVSDGKFIPLHITKTKFILDSNDTCEIHTMRFVH